MAVSNDVIQKISEIAGPGFVGLLNDPELRVLLLDATDSTPWSPQRFQAALYKTNWWRKQSESQRQWALKKAVDPAQAHQEAAVMSQQIQMQAQRMGVTMTPAELKYTTEVALQRGITSANDPLVLNTVIGISHHLGRGGPGGIQTTQTAINNYARGEFYTQLPPLTIAKWADWISAGTKTMDDFKAAMANQTVKSMPWMAQQIQGGATLHDIVGPLQQLVANELEYASPTQVNVMSDPRWRGLLGVRNSKGQMVMPTQSDVITMARRQPEWQKTSNGRQMINGLAQSLMKTFGARA